MAEEIATLPKPPELPKTGRIGFKEALGVQEPFLQRKAEMQPQMAAAEGDIAKATQAQTEMLATGKEQATKGLFEAEKKAKEDYQKKLEAEPLPAFIPTKDTAQDIAGLFSIISVIGMVVGGGGKMAGQRAMGAMNGMLEGYRKGRMDLYKQERNEFDANFKSMLQKHQEFRKEMEDAVKLASTNKEAGFAAAELAATKAGSDIVKAQLRKGDLAGAYKLVDESQKGAESALKMEQKARESEAAEKARREEAAQRERHQRERMAQTERLAQAKIDAKGLKQVQARSATNERYANTVYRSSNEVLRSMELIEQIGLTTGGGALGGVVGKGSISSEVQRQIGQYFTEEQQRNYNTAMSGVALEMAYVLNGGYKPDAGTINKIETLLSVGPNDTLGNAAYKFSDLAAKLKAAIEVSPSYTDEQKNTKEMLMKKLERYAPPEEVYTRVYGVGERKDPLVRSGDFPKPQTQAEFDALAPGAEYIDPDDGKLYKKPKAK
jgi:hypothetical protein